MFISFNNKKIRKICEDEIEALGEYGADVTGKLHDRLADLAAANSVMDIFIGNPCEVHNTPYPNYKVDLCNGYVLVFAASNVNIPTTENDLLDWSKVNRIKILEILYKNG